MGRAIDRRPDQEKNGKIGTRMRFTAENNGPPPASDIRHARQQGKPSLLPNHDEPFLSPLQNPRGVVLEWGSG